MATTSPSPSARFYELGGADGHTPVLVATFEELNARLLSGDKAAIQEMMGVIGKAVGSPIKRTALPDGRWVSTTFLSHAINAGDPPLLFETMMFRPDGDRLLQRRYATWDAALADHDVIVAAPDGALAEEREKNRAFSRFLSAMLTGKPTDDFV